MTQFTLFCEVCKEEVNTEYTDDGDLVCAECGSGLADAAAIGLHVIDDVEPPDDDDYEYPQFYSDEEPRQ